MARVKLSDPVYDQDGNVTTPGELLDEGKAVVTKTDKWGHQQSSKYFCEFVDEKGDPTGSCFEISAYAFKSRKKKGQAYEPPEPVKADLTREAPAKKLRLVL